MNTPILVTGGTGAIGSRVVPILRAAGMNVRILSRHPRPDESGIEHVEGDTVAGAGIQPALKGVHTVLHLAGGAKGDDIAARNLADAAKSAGTGHLILISVVGADKMPIGYFRAKASSERIIAESGVPWTVVRAAQLHGFVLPVVKGLARMPLTPAPHGLRFEPVHVDEVRRPPGRAHPRGTSRRCGRYRRAGSARHPAAARHLLGLLRPSSPEAAHPLTRSDRPRLPGRRESRRPGGAAGGS